MCSNLLSALHQGKLTCVSCLEHGLNLVVQRFQDMNQELKYFLGQVRTVSSHLKWSHPASGWLSEIQQEFHLPTNRVIYDMPTKRNSTFAMLYWMLRQQREVSECLYESDSDARTVAADTGCMHCIVTI